MQYAIDFAGLAEKLLPSRPVCQKSYYASELRRKLSNKKNQLRQDDRSKTLRQQQRKRSKYSFRKFTPNTFYAQTAQHTILSILFVRLVAYATDTISKLYVTFNVT